jgi:hypothetical protein
MGGPRILKEIMMTVLAFVLSVVLVVGAIPGTVSGQTLDPQSLISEWSGTWQSTGPDTAAYRGQYVLTIKRIEGAKVFCHVFVTNPRGNSQGEPVATLAGNRLSWGGQFPTEFTVSGTEMRGSRQGGPAPLEITLKKK